MQLANATVLITGANRSLGLAFARDAQAQGLDLVQLVSRPVTMDYALSNGFGFGGVNASLVFKRWAS